STTQPSATITGRNLNVYFPQEKLGGGNYIYTYSGIYWNHGVPAASNLGVNYFGLSAMSSLNTNGGPTSTANIPVAQAYAIDSKIDDGLPQSGRVMAWYVGFGAWSDQVWTDGTDATTTPNEPQPYVGALPGSSNTCY